MYVCFLFIYYSFLLTIHNHFYCFGSQQKLIENLVKIHYDGRVEVDLANNAPVASDLLELQNIAAVVDEKNSGIKKSIPRLKIAILVVGTRGDVQPFLAMAKRLQACINYLVL